jgi:hypothetical protein
MKYSLFLIISVVLLSCSRDPNSTNSNPSIEDGTFQYKVNGNLVTIKNISIADAEYTIFFKQLSGTAIPHSRYMFNGQNGVNNVWVFGIISDSLTVGNYILDTTAITGGLITTMTYNGAQSAIYYSGDKMEINITHYSDGYISGNFTAKMTPFIIDNNGLVDYSKRGTTLITEGEFKNVKCIY